jgi:hypothetical protein
MRRRVRRPTKGLRIYNRDLPSTACRFPPGQDQLFSMNVLRMEMAQRFFYKKLKDDEERRNLP